MPAAAVVVLAVLSATSAAAQRTQATRPAALTVQVVDPSGAGIPHALVVLHDEARAVDATADITGAATLSLPAGTYMLTASAPGFETRADTVRLAAGRARRVEIALPLSRVRETVTVMPEASAVTGETTIGEDEIDMLADDPNALEEFIQDVGGPDATITIDGFQDGRMPPRDQVAQIVVTTDPYSAQFHEVGYSRVDVVTKPGFGNWEGRARVNFSSDVLSARNPFATQKLPFQNLSGRFSASGPVRALGTSVSMDADIRRRTETQPLVAITPEGLVRNEVDQRDDRHSFELRTTHAVGAAGVLRNRFEWERSESVGSGLGDIDLPERAYGALQHEASIRSNLTMQLPRGVRQDIRLAVDWGSEEVTPVTERVAIDVLGAFRAGGAQVTGTVASRDIEGAAEWLFPGRGRHTIRTGVLVEQTRYDSSNVRDYLGTFVFEGIDAWLAGTPATFTQRVGSTDVAFTDTRTGIFLQDDVRLTEALSIGLGLRQEFQPSIDDMLNLAPRMSLGWTTKARTVVRFGLGAFHDWHETSLIEEAQRLEGDESYELVIRSPGYPDPLAGGTAVAPLPPTRLITGDDLVVSRNWRASMTVEKRFGRALTLRGTVYRQLGYDEPRARNVNAPVDGQRPDPSGGNVLLLASTGRSERTSAELNLTMRGLWRDRLFGHARYTLGERLDDADGAMSLPADSLRPDLEWGPSRQDVRHRGFAGLRLRLPNELNVGVTVRVQSGRPYNITAGEDLNGDTVSNDRPAGIGRNAARGDALWSTDVNLGWTRSIAGGATAQRGAGGRGGERGGARREREIGFNITARNVFNTPQYGSFNGVITSPLFGRPVSANNPRRVDVGVSFSF